MADVPGSTTRSSESGLATEPAAGVGVPAWMAARRSRGPIQADDSPEIDSDIEFASIDEADNVVNEGDSVVAPETAVGLKAPPVSEPAPPVSDPFAIDLTQPAPTKPLPAKKPTATKRVVLAGKGPIRIEAEVKDEPEDNSLRGIVMRFLYSSSMKGIAVSIVVHTSILCMLALVVFGASKLRSNEDLTGSMEGEAGGGGDSEVLIDSALPDVDSGGGGESIPIEFSDMTQLMASAGDGDFGASKLRGAGGGNGTGFGDGGSGDGMGVGAGPIPKYAVTKGSFSVWTDPRDPVPGVDYHIVIQFRLPRNVETYRGSDLTGMVTGSDTYKQAIRFNRTENFPVHDGSVQVRIRVPGADKLVRDTIRVESKLLKEKQTIEIEF